MAEPAEPAPVRPGDPGSATDRDLPDQPPPEILGWNQALFGLTGHAASDVIGKRLPEVFHLGDDRFGTCIESAFEHTSPRCSHQS